MVDTEFKKRVRVAINKVVFERNLSNKALAPLLNTTPTTISNYRIMKNMAKQPFIVRFCSLFECSKEWILTGDGRPFFDSGDTYQELFDKYFIIPTVRARKMPAVGVLESSAGPAFIKEEQAAYNADGAAHKMNVDDAMGKTYKVLSSGTPYAVALYLNIQ